MSQVLNIKQLLLPSKLASEWSSQNPVLGKGEIGIEGDSSRFKFGDGISNWNSLRYANGLIEIKSTSPLTTDINYEIGTLWIDTTNQNVFVLFAKTTTAVWTKLLNPSDITEVALASVAKKLETARTISIAGAATGSTTFDGTANSSINIVLKNSGVVAGTYAHLTIDEKGLVTNIRNITATDIPNITLSKVTDAGTSASRNVGLAAGNVPVLNAQGKLDDAVMPDLAITEVFEAATETAMLQLVAQKGDVCVRSDLDKCFILKATPVSTLSNWILLRTPTDNVLSVNGKTGVITLTTDNIGEGSTNQYFTTARATANFNTNIANTLPTALKDGDTIVLSTNEIILNCGN